LKSTGGKVLLDTYQARVFGIEIPDKSGIMVEYEKETIWERFKQKLHDRMTGMNKHRLTIKK
jgi:hypothetical protein